MSDRIKIAILSGGDTEERVVSEKSAKVVHRYLHEDRYDARLIDIKRDRWTDIITGQSIDKNDFSLDFDGSKWRPEAVFCAIHGAPMENGVIQGYFDILGIPYTCCNGFVSGLTMNKSLTKRALKGLVSMAQEVYITRKAFFEGLDMEDIISRLGLPVFVKPNAHGSSFGVRKVKTKEEFLPAIENAYKEDDEIIIESFLDGTEVSVGVINYKGNVTVLPITEIVSENDFFDYEAKYLGKSKEITPARISDELKVKIETVAKRAYEVLKMKGFSRSE
ncbi:MAG TPA: ATP-grasp domain-containing protein, partial [Saprospiraceae bacterium]|nr:ATP-grasp domain-containing protein [Saprospiraceae bacterium]